MVVNAVLSLTKRPAKQDDARSMSVSSVWMPTMSCSILGFCRPPERTPEERRPLRQVRRAVLQFRGISRTDAKESTRRRTIFLFAGHRLLKVRPFDDFEALGIVIAKALELPVHRCNALCPRSPSSSRLEQRRVSVSVHDHVNVHDDVGFQGFLWFGAER